MIEGVTEIVTEYVIAGEVEGLTVRVIGEAEDQGDAVGPGEALRTLGLAE